MPDREDPPERPGGYPGGGPQPEQYGPPWTGHTDPAAVGEGYRRRPRPDGYLPPAGPGRRYPRAATPPPSLPPAGPRGGQRDSAAGRRPDATGYGTGGTAHPAGLDAGGGAGYGAGYGTGYEAGDDFGDDPGYDFGDDPARQPEFAGFWDGYDGAAGRAAGARAGLAAGGGTGRAPRGRAGRGVRNGPAARPAGRKKRRGRRAAPITALVVLLIFVIGGGAAGYKLLRTYVIPPDFPGPGAGTVIVQIGQGQTAHDVAQTLARRGVVASPRAFIKAAEQNPRGARLQPGVYRLHRQMKASLALQLLLSPASRVQARITIPEGWRLSEIMKALGSKSGIPLSKYQAAAASPASLGVPSYADNRLEGYLFPATYEVQPGESAADVLRAMVKQFNQEASQLGVTAGAHQVSLTPGQLITVASLVQAEAGRRSDFPKIARVIYNRLAAGMRLDLDSTVMYALHTYGIMATDRQVQDTNSPYNTYLHTGLPPGPICSPGSAAIRAAMHPAAGNWLYFVTVDPAHGVTKFTASPAQFQQLRAELQQNLAKK